ncbi:MAG: hypothetical protein UW81_C0021G0011 [Candidatus Giovannonibacteria bacterium GW2011_GWC2_44_9]|uniref:Uncharacterized protein n=3 Tax=Candidatus Giovannoniibacteriota TaxID=1752738 RepID=A0A0G1L5W7_9BACT|nr:MAG: hypothetical protein UW49_C0004G0083 [Candidatus Giovannonibacteria bacterium GW2011_GWB1_44_23]KKT63972.1 MAG: hypothetical protein UW57_C0004G0082 [Candidatus Giovannonibacteria bacterium GW2011_GWA1_44_29]KKT83307.1 MAG: hypothetical protein UW81_C0021G0011 [Candidatus Giovannonibacteria bacterium GW2011_GWC2_44_9]KKT91685.1 MAG: hypothetical protein UW93_C0004G0083 [Parcubacteria group bacterium GW2011_GWC1_45_13]
MNLTDRELKGLQKAREAILKSLNNGAYWRPARSAAQCVVCAGAMLDSPDGLTCGLPRCRDGLIDMTIDGESEACEKVEKLQEQVEKLQTTLDESEKLNNTLENQLKSSYTPEKYKELKTKADEACEILHQLFPTVNEDDPAIGIIARTIRDIENMDA